MSALPAVLVLPGYQDSGPEHWQTLWERTHPGLRRVVQRDWEDPERDEWVAALDRAIAAAGGPVVLVGHSLGALTAIHWAARHRGPVRGALLVAPPDVERPDFLPMPGFAPIPLGPLPFPSIVVASADDPFTRLERARHFARCWGSEFVDLGRAGHVNAAAGFGPWPAGEALLDRLRRAPAGASRARPEPSR
jgi:predicted alpha/beta hydrolase family esterase